MDSMFSACLLGFIVVYFLLDSLFFMSVYVYYMVWYCGPVVLGPPSSPFMVCFYIIIYMYIPHTQVSLELYSHKTTLLSGWMLQSIKSSTYYLRLVQKMNG